LTPHEIFSDLPIEQFWDNYFTLGIPVIFRRLSLANFKPEPLISHVKELIYNKEAAPIGVSIWLNNESLHSLVPFFPWVSFCFEHKDTTFLYKNTRLFSCPAGHNTNWHYDAHLLFNFNLQLAGKKQWRLIPPDCNFPRYGFSQYGLIEEQDKPFLKDNAYTFILNEGDMLYIPPLWVHQVRALEEDSLSISWMGVSEHAIKPSKLLQREKEMLCLAWAAKKVNLDYYCGRLMRVYPGHFSGYAGQGWEFIRKFTSDVSPLKVLTRFLRELCWIPYYYLHRKRINKAIKKPKMAFFDSQDLGDIF